MIAPQSESTTTETGKPVAPQSESTTTETGKPVAPIA